jgi:hypothetical protein
MSAIGPAPPLPVFPAHKGEPDQPKPFFDKLMAYLAWLGSAVGEETGSGGLSGTDVIYMPLTNGQIPPVFVQNSDGSLIYIRVE